MVVIIIAALLSTLAIVYGGEGRSQVALSIEAAKVSELILQAKQLAIATYSVSSVEGTPACGYGVYFNIPSSTYSLFVYSPQSAHYLSPPTCPSLASTTASTFNHSLPYGDMAEYSQQSWQVHVSQGLVMQNRTSTGLGVPSAVAVIFFPPNPTTLITNVNSNGKFSTTSTAYVDIATEDHSASKNIMITPAGQVSF